MFLRSRLARLFLTLAAWLDPKAKPRIERSGIVLAPADAEEFRRAFERRARLPELP